MVRPMSPTARLFIGSGRLLLPEPYDGALPWAIHVSDGRVSWVGTRADAPPADETVSSQPKALATYA